jgi:hypothetical protein
MVLFKEFASYRALQTPVPQLYTNLPIVSSEFIDFNPRKQRFYEIDITRTGCVFNSPSQFATSTFIFALLGKILIVRTISYETKVNSIFLILCKVAMQAARHR